MQIFLIRHPRPLIAPGICYGRLDIDCEAPQACADRIAPLLPHDTPVFSSPLRRARRLAEALAPNIRIDDRLSEIDFGDWEGQRWDNIDRSQLDAWAADILNFTPPGGESVATLKARALDFALTLGQKNLQSAAIVSHAGFMRALFGHWQQLPLEAWMKLEFPFGEPVCHTLVPPNHGASSP